ncbi:MAG: hypothetical protein H6Q91_763 [Deltaproteobacteria bacterium]|nr:hypothetical protein [Deltaproteobacteria bacterium]
MPTQCGDFTGSAQGYVTLLPQRGGSMTTGPFEEMRSAIDPPAGLPPAEIGAALRGSDAALRGVLGLAWLAVALHAQSRFAATGLAICAALSLLGVAPRAVATGGTLLAVLIATAIWSNGASIAATAMGLVAFGALRLRIHAGGSGRWLRDVRRLELRRAAALAATGFALAKHRTGDGGALARAGDRYEREGRARAALATLGATPSAALGSVRGVAQWTARALARWPSLLGHIERAALRWSE